MSDPKTTPGGVTTTVTQRTPEGRATRLWFAATIPARVLALRNEDGAVYLQHVFTHWGDVLTALHAGELTELHARAAAAFAAEDDPEGKAVEDGKHVGSL